MSVCTYLVAVDILSDLEIIMPFPVHEHCKKMATQDSGAPWYASFPEPSSRPDSIEPAKVFALLEEQSQSAEKPKDFLLVDVRRTDWTGGTVESSINLPAHSFYPTRKIAYELCKQAGIKSVIFYCGQSCIPCLPSYLSSLRSLRQAPRTAVAPDALHGCRTISTTQVTQASSPWS